MAGTIILCVSMCNSLEIFQFVSMFTKLFISFLFLKNF